MNKEEKQVIDDIKDFISDDSDLISYDLTMFEAELILNLIEKQQKEIEELKGINAIQKYRIEVIDPRELISKDKIKEKIKELKNRKIGASTGIFAVQVDILEELLEEENK